MQGIFYALIAEPDGADIRRAGSENDVIDMCPIGGAEAHGTGFATGEEAGPEQVETAEPLAGIAYREHLGMCRRVVSEHDLCLLYTSDAADDWLVV